MTNRAQLKNQKTIVVKVGSSSLTHKNTGHINLSKMEKLIRQLSDIKHSGMDVILVSSGAQAAGISVLNLDKKPTEIEKKQAVASVGQASLMMIYQKLFREYNLIPGQVLITRDVIDQPNLRKNAVNTFKALLEYGVIPIVNENDTVATEEIEFGDNDTLSAIVAELVEADLLILLSDIDGLYDMDPTHNDHAVLIDEVEEITSDILLMATGSKTLVGTGGMVTKLQAATIATTSHIDMVIANSDRPHVLQDIIAGEIVGTLFKAQ
jgi:glutamate 5-kinase